MSGTQVTMRDDLLWGESPRWDGTRLWVSDAQAQQLVTIAPGSVIRHHLDSPVNGSWVMNDGRLAVARMMRRRVEVTADGESFELLADLSDVADGSLGDMTGTAEGNLYVDSMGADPWSGDPVGRLIMISPAGHVSVVAEELTFPNGLAVINGGRTLLVAETIPAKVTAFQVAADGSLSDRRTWFDLAELGGSHRPDGLWAAPDGSVWISAGAGHEFVRVLEGQVVDRVPTPGEFAIACCQVGARLYISTSRSADPGLVLLTEALPQRKLIGRIATLAIAD